MEASSLMQPVYIHIITSTDATGPNVNEVHNVILKGVMGWKAILVTEVSGKGQRKSLIYPRLNTEQIYI